MPKFPPYSAHIDGQQVPTIMGVEGTLGTNDTAGSARSLPFAVNPTTGAAYVDILSSSGTVTSTDAQYAVKVDESGTPGTSIVGEAAVGQAGTAATWRLKKVVDTGGTQTILTWADGNSSFDNIWDNRGTYTYS